jgi:acetylornithine/N-succinyldiaminopimelate aminotransferase
VQSVRGRGLLLAAQLTAATARDAVAAALDGGVIVNDPTPDSMRLAPPLILESSHVEEALPVLTAAIAQQREPVGAAS